MWVPWCMLLLVACVVAEDNQERRSKLPFIADALGNTLPPPSNVPATVGSPVNLLTPDRYEFYTFDESGELVKRLMTLEEIQAIVAAGEETEGLVTFANENQPTIAFNFSQPPHTKVHSVVTNVQNVLKAQMEAHKNKPQTQPPFDTPDVSDSWSLILPSIFGNTGVDIVPDKTSDSFITPETETIDLDIANFEDENSLGKERTHEISSSSTTEVSTNDNSSQRKTSSTSTTTTEKPTSTTASTTTSTTISTTTSSTTSNAAPSVTTPSTTTTVRSTTPARRRVTTTTRATTSSSTTTTAKPRTTSTSTTTTTTTARPKTTSTTTTTTTTTVKPSTTFTTMTKSKPIFTTTRPLRTTPTVHRRTTIKSTTVSPSTENLSSTVVTTTRRPLTSSKTPIIDDSSEVPNTVPPSFGAVLDSRKPVSTFVPVSTITYVTDKTTRKPLVTTKVTPTTTSTTRRIISSTSTTSIPKVQSSTNEPQISTNSYLTSSNNEQEYEKTNSTTITTQSVSPSTTVSSTEFITVHQNIKNEEPIESDSTSNDEKDNQSILPLFDVAQSISQIASDLGGNYAPLPTTNNLLDTTKINNMDIESKENLEIDIPTDSENEQKNPNNDNFVKISTLEPHEKNGNKTVTDDAKEDNKLKDQLVQKLTSSTFPAILSSTTSTSTTIDPILSESMEDLLSQVVHSAPESIISSDKNFDIMKQENLQADIQKNETKDSIKIDNVISTTQKSNNAPTFNKNSENDVPFTNNTNKIDILKDTVEKSPIDSVSGTKESEIANEQTKKQNEESESQSNFTKLETIKETQQQDIVSVIAPNEERNETIKVLSSTTTEDNLVSSTESSPVTKAESTTSKLVSTTRQQDANIPYNTEKNRFSSSSEKNRLTNNHYKEKQPVVFPKVDEFKKKIQKVNIDDKELANERNNSWKLISTVSPPKANDINKDKHKNDNFKAPEINEEKNIILDFSKENQGLEVTTKDLGEDIAQFTELCNELAFQYWANIVKDVDAKRSFVLSPYSITSMLAMMFMGARGSTSGEMNEILKLDDMVTFNPHFTLKNISDSIETSPSSGVAISAFIRELYSDRSKGKVLTFYKERAQHFYNGHVEEINFNLISDIIRRRTNLLVKRYTWGKIIEYMKTNTIMMHPPLAAFSANIFQTDCSSSSVDGRDGEMYFVVSPNVRQRRLVPVPAVVYRSNFLAGYDPVLDATAAALGNTNSIISTLFLMPGQQGNVVHAEDLEALEKRLLESNPATPTWNRLLRTLLPRVGLELQIPRFSHKSIFNVSSTLRRMGLKDLFDQEHADLGGLNGPSKDLYLSDMIQMTTFVTCGEGVIAEQHHIEEYPETLDLTQKRRAARWLTGWDEPRDYQRAFHDPHDVSDAMHLPLHLRPRQARLPSRNAQPARLKFDRPFLFFVRHNKSGMILYVGRYNPRLLP